MSDSHREIRNDASEVEVDDHWPNDEARGQRSLVDRKTHGRLL
jgi:hypothetical protein